MRICFICMNLHSYGGIQRVLVGLLNELIKKKGTEFSVIMPVNPDDDNIYGLDEKVKIINLNNFHQYKKNTLDGFLAKGLWLANKRYSFLDMPFFNLITQNIVFSRRQQKQFKEFLNEGNFDVVIGVGDYYSLLLALIAKEVSSKCIGWMHSTYENYFYTKGVSSYGLLELSKNKYKNLDALVVLSKEDKKVFYETFKIKTYILPNPVNFYSERPIADARNPILFVGRMVKDLKGLDYLAQIIEHMVNRQPRQKFIIVGDGPDKKEFEIMLEQKKLKDNVQLIGMTNEVERFYKESSILIHTSRGEGFGVVILEAMMFGLPVVAFHNKGPDDIIACGKDGILIEKYECEKFAQEIERILQDKELYRMMSYAANEKAKQYMPNIILEKLSGILEEIVK